MKLLGTNPTLILAFVASIITAAGTWGLGFIDPLQAVLLIAVVNGAAAAINAWTVKPVSPAAYTYLVGAVAALFAGYGLDVKPEILGGINGMIVPVLALLARDQVTVQDTAVTHTTTAEG